ncbi:MAG: FHA domain-containing protein [Muribaculaceae bacterium]|nr:FHA domain-containing protein [Muribaculaceae bacterium]
MRLLKIGRDTACDIVLHSSKVSSLHAEITLLNNGDILLEDKNSTNGTYVMNRPIKPGTQVTIKHGDAIRFADVELLWSQIPMPEDNSGYKAVFGIGSNFRNEIQLSGNTVSRFHATLKIDKKGKAFLQDHSKNGSTVNGMPVKNGQTVRVKRSDSIVCGGVPVNISQYIPGNMAAKAMRIAASLIILIGCAYGIYKYFFDSVTPITTEAMQNATACVYGGYYFTVEIKDDPFNGKFKDWPTVWTFGHDGSRRLVNKNFNIYCDELDMYRGEVKAFNYTGTAFFISEDGEMGTNRHVAVPWEYDKKDYEEVIRNFIGMMKTYFAGKLASKITSDSIKKTVISERYNKSDIEIGGIFEFLGIGLTGTKVNSVLDIHHCQVIAESGDKDKDVALIRLNTRKTPEYLVKMKAVYDITKARVDETSLKPQEDEFLITGYPLGEWIGTKLFNGAELRPTMHKATLSNIPDDNCIQIQVVGTGGQSGSPVIDKKHRLVGVLCSGFGGTEVTYCCNIKHLVELYNKHKVRK